MPARDASGASDSSEPACECGLETSVPDWILEYPETLPVFSELDIDTSCGGKSLEYVCVQRSLSPGSVLSRLQQVITQSGSNRD